MGGSYSCDSCGLSPIVNIRYHCAACNNDNFDACWDCKDKAVTKENIFEHLTTHEVTVHDCDQAVLPLKNSDGVTVSRGEGDHLKIFYCSRTDPVCTPDHLCSSCESLNKVLLKNSDGFPVFRGTTVNTHQNLYCGRFFGPETIVGDGFCGPNNGPQCHSCELLNGYVRKNGLGNPVAIAENGLYYCSRFIKKSGGFCGPCEGPQCEDCEEYQKNPVEPPLPVEITGPTNQMKYNWRRELLKNLLDEGHITRAQFSQINKENKNKLEIPPKHPGVSREVKLLLALLERDEVVITKIQQLWEKYDTNKNGNLEMDEAIKFFKDFEEATLQLTKEKQSEQSNNTTITNEQALKYGSLYDEIDTNKSGGIDYTEFLQFLKNKSKESNVKQVDKEQEELVKAVDTISNECKVQ